MASGDPFVIGQISGVSSAFSYTPAAGVYLCITACAGYSVTLNLSAAAAPYYFNWIRLNEETGTSNNNQSMKKIFGNGLGVFVNHTHINSYGVNLSGIEL